ncbi:hypothetical protein BOSP111201_04395 [Bordetella sputigena]|uniref:hypothetical protein n=1 Tax=Bordetella sputigena TaxID=1416810 RepID=UPI0039EECE03
MGIPNTAIGVHAGYLSFHPQAETKQARQAPDTQAAAVDLPPASSADVITDLLSRVTATDVSQLGELWINGVRGDIPQVQAPAAE